MSITQTMLQEILHYCPETGIFTWIKSKSKKVKPGTRAGCRTPQGYRVIRLGGKNWYEHQLAWLYVMGEPTEEDGIHHKNQVRDDNAFCNLKPCPQSDNAKCRGMGKNNRSGIKGVYRDTRKKNKQWFSRIMVDGEDHFLGYFGTSREAALAYNEAAIRFHGEFACLAEVPEEYGLNSHPCA